VARDVRRGDPAGRASTAFAESLGPLSVPLEHQRFAFRYGVAVHDVEPA
jgi:hypothetical protein